MKYTEYVAKITETMISPKVQFKRRFLQSLQRLVFSQSSSSSFKRIQCLAFVELLHVALGPVYPQVSISQFSILYHNGHFSNSGSHMGPTLVKPD